MLTILIVFRPSVSAPLHSRRQWEGLHKACVIIVSRFHIWTSYYRMRLYGHSVSRSTHTCQKFGVWIIQQPLHEFGCHVFVSPLWKWREHSDPSRPWAWHSQTEGIEMCNAWIQCWYMFKCWICIFNFNSFQESRVLAHDCNRRVSLWHNSFANRTWGILIPMFGSSNDFLQED